MAAAMWTAKAVVLARPYFTLIAGAHGGLLHRTPTSEPDDVIRAGNARA
jgi:hypothetical protein